MLLVVALGLGVVVAGSVTWGSASVPSPLSGLVPVDVPGRSAAPGVVAGGLVAAASGLALGLAGRVGARLAALVVVAGGLLAAWSAVDGARDLRRAALAAARDQAGVDALAGGPTATAAPWAATALGVLTAAAGVLALVRAGRWAPPRRMAGDVDGAAARGTAVAGPSSGAPGPGPEVDSRGAWDALDRGEDPT